MVSMHRINVEFGNLIISNYGAIIIIIVNPNHSFLIFSFCLTVVEPISSQAQLRINPKPANDLSHPQAWLNLVVNSIGLALRQNQVYTLLI